MVQAPWRQPPLTPAEANDLFMLTLEDDSEEAPWMITGDLQFWSASGFAHSLRHYARQHGLGWYVASMLPIEYDWPYAAGKKKLAPDTMVAFVADHERTSFDADAEGGFPPFVLEVVSPSSKVRDEQQKHKAYELLGVREYALFTPRASGASTLAGYQRNTAGEFEEWPADAEGRLWSNVLELYLVARGRLLQAQTAAGEWLLTLEQAEAARLQAEVARRQAEEEAERLRQELARYRRAEPPPEDGGTTPS
jgi:Uma2 family endonuclease